MLDETSKRTEQRTGAGTAAAGATGALALAFCCGGGFLAAGLGLGALAAFLVNPWFLFPFVLLTARVVYWRANRVVATCDIQPPQTRHGA